MEGKKGMFLVTGAAGFIGSNLVASLNHAGVSDIVINDTLGKDERWRNLSKRHFTDFVPPADLWRWLEDRKLDAVVHLGAISDTTIRDADLTMEVNFRLSLRLADWCTATRTRFLYASTAATYGDGSNGFSDEWTVEALRKLRPLNLYGWSKHCFDLVMAGRYASRKKLPPQWAGLKFFNVYGPNEYHKGAQASIIAKVCKIAQSGNAVSLFKSYHPDFADGDQARDFIYVEDAVRVVEWLLSTPTVSGIFNVGTGRAESFKYLVAYLFAGLDREPNIEYVDMPEQIRSQYQYFTQADQRRLREAGYSAEFMAPEQAVTRYVKDYLVKDDRYR
jgi:ADP-L-glycero-D-manno-heptose 6-epimerase